MLRAGVLGVSLTAGAILAACALMPAQATQICSDPSECTYEIDHFAGKGAEPNKAPWGTITLTQGDGFVEISVVLKGKNSFTNNGGSAAFMFNLSDNVQITAASILEASSAFSFDPHVGNTSAGHWHYGMICDACTDGHSKINSLDFRISGISLADFIANNRDFAFGAGLCFNYSRKQESCRTIGEAASQLNVPEPMTLSLLGVGLLAMAALRRRSREVPRS